MQIDINESEKKTLLFYLEKAKINAEGLKAIGVTDDKTVNNIKSLIYKIKMAKENKL